MLIRRLSSKDVPSLMRLAHFFWEESAMCTLADYPEDHIYRTLFNNLSSEGMIGWGVSDGSKISCGIIFINSLNIWTQQKQLCEVAWFNEKDSRFGLSSVKLIKKAEKWAKENNYSFITMGRIKGPLSYDKLPLLYHKMGYQSLEETFIKKI